MKRIISIFIVVCFLVTGPTGACPVYAQLAGGEFVLPKPGTMMYLTPAYEPVVLKALVVHPEDPFKFDFVLDTGDSHVSAAGLKAEGMKSIKYFMSALTVPENDTWVNLSPYEKDRIIPSAFGITDMGRDLLTQDYLLKQLTASLTYPEGELGRKFWKKVYQKAYETYGTTNIPVNTFNKVWIVPDKAAVYEHGNKVLIVQSRLKVMLDQDYLSLQKHLVVRNATISIGANIVREIILPQLEKEVNEGKTFANLRQIYRAQILATWYKIVLKRSILNKIYSNRNKVKGIDIKDKKAQQEIYQQYLKAFKKGVYNYIKEENDPATSEIVPRKYFSGGYNLDGFAEKLKISQEPTRLTYRAALAHGNQAMITARMMGIITAAALSFASLKMFAQTQNSPSDSIASIKKDIEKNEQLKTVTLREIAQVDSSLSLLEKIPANSVDINEGAKEFSHMFAPTSSNNSLALTLKGGEFTGSGPNNVWNPSPNFMVQLQKFFDMGRIGATTGVTFVNSHTIPSLGGPSQSFSQTWWVSDIYGDYVHILKKGDNYGIGAFGGLNGTLVMSRWGFSNSTAQGGGNLGVNGIYYTPEGMRYEVFTGPTINIAQKDIYNNDLFPDFGFILGSWTSGVNVTRVSPLTGNATTFGIKQILGPIKDVTELSGGLVEKNLVLQGIFSDELSKNSFVSDELKLQASLKYYSSFHWAEVVTGLDLELAKDRYSFTGVSQKNVGLKLSLAVNLGGPKRTARIESQGETFPHQAKINASQSLALSKAAQQGVDYLGDAMGGNGMNTPSYILDGGFTAAIDEATTFNDFVKILKSNVKTLTLNDIYEIIVKMGQISQTDYNYTNHDNLPSLDQIFEAYREYLMKGTVIPAVFCTGSAQFNAALVNALGKEYNLNVDAMAVPILANVTGTNAHSGFIDHMVTAMKIPISQSGGGYAFFDFGHTVFLPPNISFEDALRQYEAITQGVPTLFTAYPNPAKNGEFKGVGPTKDGKMVEDVFGAQGADATVDNSLKEINKVLIDRKPTSIENANNEEDPKVMALEVKRWSLSQLRKWYDKKIKDLKGQLNRLQEKLKSQPVQPQKDSKNKDSKPVGGIDIRSSLLGLQIQRDGKGIDLSAGTKPVDQIQIDGCRPVIIKIVSVNLPVLLGLGKF